MPERPSIGRTSKKVRIFTDSSEDLALKQCKSVIDLDKSNYNAWIFAGVAASNLEQTAQAEQGYRKAIEIDANNPLAWKGLADLFAKSNERDSAKVALVFRELIRLW